MTRLEKCELAIQMGYTYNPDTGKIFGIKNKTKEITRKDIDGYINISNSKINQLRGHIFAWYWVHKEIVDCLDHINGIRDDNRICNLRSVTNQQNLFNTKSKGYSWNKKNKKYKSQIRLNGKYIYLGLFNSEDDARQAYLEGKKKYHNL